jgi:hypothetical protein
MVCVDTRERGTGHALTEGVERWWLRQSGLPESPDGSMGEEAEVKEEVCKQACTGIRSASLFIGGQREVGHNALTATRVCTCLTARPSDTICLHLRN